MNASPTSDPAPTPTRESLIAAAVRLHRRFPSALLSDVAETILRHTFRLGPQDGILSGSPAALAMGWRGAAEDVDHFQTIVDDLQQELLRAISQSAQQAPPKRDLAAEYAALTEHIRQQIPEATGYDGGFRDAVESMALALQGAVTAEHLRVAVKTALDAFGNHTEEQDDTHAAPTIRG